MRIWPGSSTPLGATFDGVGTNIAVFSDVAEAVELCVFDPDGTEHRVELPERSGSVWHGYLPDLDAGTPLRLPGPRTVRPGRRRIGATPTSCCSTRTPVPSRATSTGTRRRSATRSAIPTVATTATAQPSRPAASW